MKITQLLALSLVCCLAPLTGCFNGGGSSPPQSANFTVVPDYGSPGAYSIDTLTRLSGSTAGGYNCDPATDGNCRTSFINEYASTTSNPAGYTFQTDAVGNVDWDLSGTSSNNCSAGYPQQIVSVSTQTSYALICASPIADFTSSEPDWIPGKTPKPTTITFTAVNTSFPAQNFGIATTVYDPSANVQWSGTVVSSSKTQVTVPISNTVEGTHIVVFRSPSNNSVIGSSAYVVSAPANPPPCPTAVTRSVTPDTKPICPGP